MSFAKLIRSTVLGVVCWTCVPLVLLADDSQEPKANSPTKPAAAEQKSTPAAASGDAEFQQVFVQWQSVLSELAQLQIQHRTATSEQRAAMTAQISEFVQKAKTLDGQLQAAAEKAYAADANNHEAGNLLLTMAVAALRKDSFDQSLELAKFLIDHHYPGDDALRVAASSAFALMQLDDAKKYLSALAEIRPSDPTVAPMFAAIEKYRPKWEREQKLRAAEAKADDLPRVKLKTSQGDIVVELFENEAPNTVANFINLVEKGFYDGTQFHRVLPGFMAQGGDPNSKNPTADPATIGSGGPGYTIADECDRPDHRDHFRGSLSMAHTNQPNSGGSQFFICFVPTEQLDGKHTVFGRVIEGMDVLSKLQRIDPAKERENASGVIPDKIEKAEVLRKRDHPYEPKKIGEK